MDIPFSGMAFYHPEERACDFHFLIAAQETDKHRELLWGSEEFAIPTFLYQRHDGQFDWITKQKDRSPGLSFRISRDWNQFVLYEDHTKTNGERAFHEFGSLFSYAVLNHHACVLHGVVMEYNGMGILVLASAGTGKTTHTRMWRDHKNALILNGDRCLCRKKDGVWYAYGMPWSGSSGEYINRRVPISCIVCLNRGLQNTVQPLSIFDGTISLMQRIFAPAWPGELQNQAFSYCEELASEIPVLDFYCRPDLESVEVLAQAIQSLGEKNA
ncbi:hypothetical protein [Sharpea azabuensis]|uniref:hypothetical protein n=1 Tax=Sharpea azabuensis TaxID=322505 RepID=UPI00156940C2|nr:hypothetical protein [Sharpea azabuensis]